MHQPQTPTPSIFRHHQWEIYLIDKHRESVTCPNMLRIFFEIHMPKDVFDTLFEYAIIVPWMGARAIEYDRRWGTLCLPSVSDRWFRVHSLRLISRGYAKAHTPVTER